MPMETGSATLRRFFITEGTGSTLTLTMTAWVMLKTRCLMTPMKSMTLMVTALVITPMTMMTTMAHRMRLRMILVQTLSMPVASLVQAASSLRGLR